MIARLGRTVLGLAMALVWSSGALAQESTAAEAVDRFLSLNSAEKLESVEGQGLRTGEAAEWNVPAIGPLPDRHDRLIHISEDEAVARVAANPPDGDPVDLYFYLEAAQDGWRVSAMRTLALPPFVYMMIDELEAQPSRSTEEAAMLANLRLVTRPDAELHRWFGENRSAIDALAEAYERLPPGSGAVREDSDAAPEVSAALNALHLTQITAEEGRLVVLIGGFMDNSVGLIRTATPPRISPTEYIWVEPLAGGWFLFKTT